MNTHCIKSKSNSQPKWLLYFVGCVFLVAIFLVTLWLIWGEVTLTNLLNGDGPEYITNLLNYHRSLDPGIRSVLYYSNMIESILFRFGFMVLFSSVVLWFSWPYLSARYSDFMNESASAHSLAIFRIICFGTLLYYPDYDVIVSMSELPSDLLIPPPGWHGLLKNFMPNAKLTVWLIPVYQVTVVAALLGYRTRMAAFFAVVLGVWLLGIPQFYGKINHYHHLFWFATIAIFAPVSDVWSLDSRRHRNHINPKKHRFYLGVILLSIFTIYFFAGWWKLIGGGFSWIWGEAARWQIEAQLLRLGKNSTGCYNDNPWLFKLIGLLTVLFELSWGWFMLARKTRPFILVLGVIFHLSIYIFMDINFWQLTIFYCIFLPYHEWFNLKQEKQLSNWIVPKFHWSKLYLALIMAFGFFHIDSWPMAVYPSFCNPLETRVWQVSLDFYQEKKLRTVNLAGDVELRSWLPKTRLMGLHGQLTGNENVAIHKIKLLDSFYCRALGISISTKRRYVKRMIDIENGQALEIRELWKTQ
jgi:hypothetical protein